MTIRVGLENMPVHPLVRVWCRRCSKAAGLWVADSNGGGLWRNEHRHRCRCDPPPTLPQGKELDGLIARAWRSTRSDRRRPINISR